MSGPFSDEHVFPAGLGGDDHRFLLKNLVCANRNTDQQHSASCCYLKAALVVSMHGALPFVLSPPNGRALRHVQF
jgi:hypothetical protein